MGRHGAVTLSSKRRTIVGATAIAIATTASIAVIQTSNGVSATSANLVRDPAFLTGVANWATTAGGSLSMVDGHDGHRAIRLLNNSAGTMTLALNDRVNTVATTTAGATYQAGAWVRTDAPGVTAGSRMMEYQGSALHGSKQGSAWLRTTDWSYVSATYTATTSVSSIDFNLLGWALPRGKSLFVSDPSLVEVSGGSGTSSSAPSSTAASSSSSAPTSVAPTTPDYTPSVPVTTAHQPPPITSSAGGSTPPGGGGGSTPTPTPAPSGPSGYHLVWSDDFSSINTAKWNVRNNSWANNEQSIDTSRPQNVFISNGALTLRAIKQSYTAYGTTRQYTSGYLDTIGKESWKYGRIEMRAKLPTAQGLWPAFWLRNDVGLGELDIMEAIGGMNNKSVQTVHQSTNGDMARKGHEDTLPAGSNADWHVYAVDREPGFMNWYVDNRLVFSVTESQLSWLDPTFNSPMNIRLNLQVGGSMPAYYQKPVGATPTGASDYVIDYVRVYQK
jgi:Glycosyl hydrolases family 16